MAINSIELNKTFEEFNGNFSISNKSKNLKLKLIYSPEERITALSIRSKDVLTRNKDNENNNDKPFPDLNLFINPYRHCIIGKK
jgi:hypothetical protein